MGFVGRNGCRAGIRTALLIIALLAISLFAGGTPGSAADIRVVTGTVQAISAAAIEVGGQTYNISGVALRDASAKPLSPSDISYGTRVTLYFRGDRLVRVRVYPKVLE